MNDLKEQTKVEQVPLEPNEKGVPVSLKFSLPYTECDRMGKRRAFLAPCCPLHQVYRNLQEAGGVLRSDCSPLKTHFYKENPRVNNDQDLRD